jgi:pyruvate/2-oxoglutarate dehydrogenase complex dihydrolipoamide dehydrogenase (E3) component
VRRGGGQIVGATVVASHAGEMITELTMAIATGVGLGRLGDVIHPYPTQTDAIRRAAGLYNRTRLTPLVAGLMRRWFAFSR